MSTQEKNTKIFKRFHQDLKQNVKLNKTCKNLEELKNIPQLLDNSSFWYGRLNKTARDQEMRFDPNLNR